MPLARIGGGTDAVGGKGSQLRALERAYRRDPGLSGRFASCPTKEEARRIEIISVRDLANGHIEFVKLSPGRKSACEKQVLMRLAALLQE